MIINNLLFNLIKIFQLILILFENFNLIWKSQKIIPHNKRLPQTNKENQTSKNRSTKVKLTFLNIMI